MILNFLICYAGFEDGGDYPDEYPDAYEKFKGTQEELEAYILAEETTYQINNLARGHWRDSRKPDRWLQGVYSGEQIAFIDPLEAAKETAQKEEDRRLEQIRQNKEADRLRKEEADRRTYETLHKRFGGDK